MATTPPADAGLSDPAAGFGLHHPPYPHKDSEWSDGLPQTALTIAYLLFEGAPYRTSSFIPRSEPLRQLVAEPS